MNTHLINLLKQTYSYSDEQIQKLQAIASNPQALQHAQTTGDFNTAYEMTQPKKQEITLDHWFSEFTKEKPNEAETLSIALTEFSDFVRSKIDPA